MGYTPTGSKTKTKISVAVTTTADITLSGTQTIDGIGVVADDRVLVKDQSTGSENGVYVVAAGAWSRSSDADQDAEVQSGDLIWVQSGTISGGKYFVISTNDPISVGVTSVTYELLVSGAISGTGTTNSIAYFDGASSITSESGPELVWDPVNDRLGVGTSSPEATMHVVDASILPAIIERTGGGNQLRPVLKLKRSETSNMSNGFGTSVEFAIQDSSAVEHIAGSVGAIRDSNSDTRGQLQFLSGTNGTQDLLLLGYDETVFNEGGADINFRVETIVNDTALWVDGQFGGVGIGTSLTRGALTVDGVIGLAETTAPTGSSGFGKLYVQSSDAKLYFKDESGTTFDLTASGMTGSGTTNNIAYFDSASSITSESAGELYWDSGNNRLGVGTASPAYIVDVSKDFGGAIRTRIVNANAGITAQALQEMSNGTSKLQMGVAGTGYTTPTVYGASECFIQSNGGDLHINSIVSGSDANVFIHTRSVGGTEYERASFSGAGETVFNEPGEAYDLRIESNNNANMLFVDGTNDTVSVGTSTSVEALTVEGALAVDEITAPSATAGYGKLYVKSADSKLYFKDGSGTEFDLTAGGGVTGSGTTNSLAYFDSASSITSEAGDDLMWDAVNNRLGMGNANPSAALHIDTVGTTIDAGLVNANDAVYVTDNLSMSMLSTSNTTSNSSIIRGVRSRGDQAVPTAVGSLDRTLAIVGSGYDGGTLRDTAYIAFNVDGAVSASNVPQRIDFATGTTTSAAVRMAIDSTGHVNLKLTGTEALPTLSFGGSENTGLYTTGGSTMYVTCGGNNAMTFTSNNNVTVNSFYFRVQNGASNVPSFSFASDTNTGLYSGGTDILGVTAGGDPVALFGSTSIVMNPDADNVDFQVKTDSNSFMFYIDGGTNKIGINESIPNEVLTINGTLSMKETTPPSLSANYGKIYAYASDLYFIDKVGTISNLSGAASAVSGTVNHLAYFDSASSITSEAAGELYWDPTNNRLGINKNSPGYSLDVEHTNVPIRSTRTSAVTNLVREALKVKHETSGSMADDFGVSIGFSLEDTTAVENTVAFISGLRDGADGSGALSFSVGSSGTIESLRLKDDEAVFNEDAAAGMNFRVESDNEPYALFVDGGSDRVGVGTDQPDRIFTSRSPGGEPAGSFLRHQSSSDAHNVLDIVADNSIAISNAFGGMIDFMIGSNTQAPTSVGRIGVQRYNADNTGQIMFKASTTGTEKDVLALRTDEMTINPEGFFGDVDLRMNSSAGNVLIFADGGAAEVGIGTSNTNEVLTVEGALSLDHQTAPGGTTGYGKVYAKNDDTLHFVDEAGVDRQLGYAKSILRSLSANTTLTAKETGTIVTNGSAAGTITVTLPSADPGLVFEFAVSNAFNFTISSAAGDNIRNSAGVSSIPGTASSSTVGTTVRLVAITIGTWVFMGSDGTWTLA